MANVPVYENDAVVIVDVLTDGQTDFAYDFLCYLAKDMRVMYTDPSGADFDLDSWQFSVSGLGQPNGGTVTLIGYSVLFGGLITMYRDTAIERTADYQKAGDFRAETINHELDVMIMIDQELRRDVNRTVKMPVGQDGIIIYPGDPGQVPAFDADGDLIPTDANGLGNMLKEIYDPEGRGLDIYAEIEGARPEIMRKPVGQRRVQSTFFGFNNGVTDTQIFPNAQRAPQGVTSGRRANAKRRFVRGRSDSGTSAWSATETGQIVEFDYKEDGSETTHNTKSQNLKIGHQGLKAIADGGGTIQLYTGMAVEAPYTGQRAGKGFSIVDYKGNATAQADVVSYRLFGDTGSGHRYERFYGATITASQKLVCLAANDVIGESDDLGHHVFIYDRAEVLNAPDPLNVDPLTRWPLRPPPQDDLYSLQGIDLSPDDKHMAIFRGYVGAFAFHMVEIYETYLGNRLGDITFDDVRAEYSKTQMLDHPTLGVCVGMEVEGGDWSDAGIDILVTNVWRQPTDIVSWMGKNWACINNGTGGAGNIGNPPSEQSWWVETTKAATLGEWNPLTAYFISGNYTAREKLIYRIQIADGSIDLQPLDHGIVRRQSLALLQSGQASVDMVWAYNRVGQFYMYAEALEKLFKAFSYNMNEFRIHDARPGSNNELHADIEIDTSNGRHILLIRSNDNNAGGAGINLYGLPDGDRPGQAAFFATKADASFIEWLNYNPNTGELGLKNKVGTFTANMYDATSAGNVSPTAGSGRYSRIGSMVFINFTMSAISIAGMTGAVNAYIRGHGFTPVDNAVLNVAYSNVDVTAAFLQLVAEIQTDGNIFLREERDAGTNNIVDVSQMNGASIRVSGWFEVAN